MRGKAFVLAVSVVMLFCLAFSNPALAAPRQLKINTFSVSGSPWHNAMLKFAELVKNRTNGEIEILVYADAQLGDMNQTLIGMRTGLIDMAYFDIGVASFVKEYQAMQIVFCPYLFESKKDSTKVLNSQLIREYLDAQTPKAGFRIFAISGDRSPRAMQTIKGPIKKPEDLKDMKLRMIPVEISLETARALGAKPIGMGMSEVYMALKQGVVDGQDNGFDLSLPPKFHEVAKYWASTDHVYSVTGWYVGEKVWSTFSDAQKVILTNAAKEAGKVATDQVQQLEDHGIETLKKSGCTYVVPDRKAFRAATSGVYKKFEGKIWPAGWYEQIQKMQK